MVVTITKTPKAKRGKGSEVNWEDIKEDWIVSRMADSGRGLTSKELAQKWGVAEPTVRNRSSSEKWKEQLEKRVVERDTVVAEKLKEVGAKAIQTIQQELIGNEVEIRRRHAHASRMIQQKALLKLKNISIDDISVKDAIAMLKLGIDEERKAMGFEVVFVPGTHDPKVPHGEYTPLSVQSDQHKEVQKIGHTLLAELQRMVSKSTAQDAVILDDEENEESDEE